MIIGAILIIAVIAGGRGVYGGLERLIEIRKPRPANARGAAPKLAGARADA
jgi:hypothetical protein